MIRNFSNQWDVNAAETELQLYIPDAKLSSWQRTYYTNTVCKVGAIVPVSGNIRKISALKKKGWKEKAKIFRYLGDNKNECLVQIEREI